MKHSKTKQAVSRTTSFSSSLHSPTLRGEISDGYAFKLPNGNEVTLTRRHFLYGLAGVAAVAALGTGGYVLDEVTSAGEGSASTLSVAEDSVFTTEDCTQIEDASTAMGLAAQFELPYGTLIWANDDTWAACLLPTEQAKPLVKIGLVSLTAATYHTVLSNAIGESEGFEIYDVRACTGGIIWTEADIMDGIWRVYGAATNNATLGEPILLEEGDSDWEMPTIAAIAGHVWWQVLPHLNGSKTTEASKLKRAKFGSSEVQEVYSSNGRMCTPVYAAADGVVITPRSQTSGTHYQLTHINEAGEVTDTLILPASMRPLEAGYTLNGFNFMFDAIYSYGGGIANLGTYTPANYVAPAGADYTGAAGADAYSAPTWFRFPRTPLSAPASCGKWFMVKSTTAVCGIDLEAKQYFTLEVKSGCDSYGDYLATTGHRDRIVTFSQIDYAPLDGEAQKCCLVRVWASR